MAAVSRLRRRLCRFGQSASLRIRLVRTLLGRLVVALLLADVATSWLVYNLLLHDLDAQLSATSVLMNQYISAQSAAHRSPELADTASAQWEQAAQSGMLPSLMLMRLAGGTAQQVGTQPSISAAMKPGAPGSGADKDGAAFYTVDQGSIRYRVRVSYLPDHEGTLVLATSEEGVVTAMKHIGGAEAVTALLAFCLVGLVASWRIKLQLRPFERMGDQIVLIGSGELDQRVTPAEPSTELGRVGHSVNLMLTRLEHAFNEQRASENRLRRFIADASHELRTPLASIRGYAELFRRGASSRPEDLALAMRRIESEASRMGVLVDELLLLARLDSGRPLDRAIVDLSALIRDAARDSQAADPRWPVELEPAEPADAAEPAEPVHVIGDADRLRQMLANLLSNVRAHTPPGTRATIGARREGGEAVLEVADQGPGLDEAKQKLVFERFYRADASRGRGDGTGGSGLGLSIVSSVAEAHGGTAARRRCGPDPASAPSSRCACRSPGPRASPPRTGPTAPGPRASRRSVEDRLTGPGPLELEEALGARDQQHPVPELGRGLALGRRGDHRAEERHAAGGDHRGADVHAHLVHALVVRLRERLVVRVGLGRVGQRHRQPDLGQRGLDRLPGELLLAQVPPRAQRLVERADDLLAVLLPGRDQHPHRAEAAREHLLVALRQLVPARVEHRERHHVEAHVDRTQPLHLDQPAAGQPGPGAQRVDPEVGDDPFLHSFRHNSANAGYPSTIPRPAAVVSR
jgi:two-component system OmpR family sensor kinase